MQTAIFWNHIWKTSGYLRIWGDFQSEKWPIWEERTISRKELTEQWLLLLVKYISRFLSVAFHKYQRRKIGLTLIVVLPLALTESFMPSWGPQWGKYHVGTTQGIQKKICLFCPRKLGADLNKSAPWMQAKHYPEKALAAKASTESTSRKQWGKMVMLEYEWKETLPWEF